jgi:hypothetical protein
LLNSVCTLIFYLSEIDDLQESLTIFVCRREKRRMRGN